MKVVITGNSNSGKTTLFNGLTKSNERVGNWHGVTVDTIEGKFRFDKKTIDVVDLPGLSSFDAYTMEEASSVKYLREGDYDLIVNVIEALRLDAALSLTQSLTKLNKPILCLVNCTEDLIKSGGKIDYELLKDCGLNFIKINATKRRDLAFLKKIIAENDFVSPRDFDYEKAIKSFTPPKNPFTFTDKIFTHKIYGTLCFILFCISAFYLSFGKYGVGRLLSDRLSFLIEIFGNKCAELLNNFGASEFTLRLVLEGVFGGIGVLAGLLPSIIIMNFCLIYLEQSGLIARFSYVFDGLLNKFGLNGRALFVLLSGFGCTTVSLTLTKGLENRKMKEKVSLCLPFIGCTAKLPVYLYICSKVFKQSFLVIVALYFFGLIFAASFCNLFFNDKKEKIPPLILELPIIRINCLKNTLKPLINSVKQFIIKVSAIVLSVSIVVFLLSAISIDLTYVAENDAQNSVLAFWGGVLVKIFAPVGITDFRIGAAVLCGLFAKEAFLSTLTTLGFSGTLSLPSCAALLTFIAFYPPCFAALSVMKKEIGFKLTAFSFVFQTIFALLAAHLCYFALNRPIIALLIILVIILSYLFKRFLIDEKFQIKRKN